LTIRYSLFIIRHSYGGIQCIEISPHAYNTKCSLPHTIGLNPYNPHRAICRGFHVLFVFFIIHDGLKYAFLFNAPDKDTPAISCGHAPALRCRFYTTIAPDAFPALVENAEHQAGTTL
jgi:hypothetical protein